MKLGIIGLPQSGKATVFAALSGARGETPDQGGSRSEAKMVTVTVHDERIDKLSAHYRPKKTTFARIEYLLPSDIPGSSPSKAEGGLLNQVRTCDGLLLVLRNFTGSLGSAPGPEKDFRQLEDDMIVGDLVVAEKRLERIELDQKRGKKPESKEIDLLQACRQGLEDGEPLRDMSELAREPLLKGFTFLSAKPLLAIINNEDEDEAFPAWERKPEGMDFEVVRGRLEMDIASMSSEEAEEFQEAYNIRESALDRIIRKSYHLLDQISFFTVGADEVRAWSIPARTIAVEAAAAVHTDMKKGFIRAEVVAYEDFQARGGFQEAKKAGLVRLEGKEYEVKDGDIINFRFNV